jgi:hypothetical protein
MQRHLFVQHSKAEMRVLRRGIVASKRWVMEQRWGEVRPPSPWTVEVLVVHVFLGASKETRMSTTFLLEAVIRALASWHTIEVRKLLPFCLQSLSLHHGCMCCRCRRCLCT